MEGLEPCRNDPVRRGSFAECGSERVPASAMSYSPVAARQRKRPLSVNLTNRTTFMQPQPTARGKIETGLVFGRAALMLLRERPVDQLDADAAVLHWEAKT